MEPPEGELCDVAIGYGHDRIAGKPIITRCGKPATEEIRYVRFPWPIWLCKEHAEHMLRKEGYYVE